MVILWNVIVISWNFIVIEWNFKVIDLDFRVIQWSIDGIYPLVKVYIANWKPWPSRQDVSFPNNSMGIF